MDGVSGGPGASALKAVVLVRGAEDETALVLPVDTDTSHSKDSATLNPADGKISWTRNYLRELSCMMLY